MSKMNSKVLFIYRCSKGSKVDYCLSLYNRTAGWKWQNKNKMVVIIFNKKSITGPSQTLVEPCSMASFWGTSVISQNFIFWRNFQINICMRFMWTRFIHSNPPPDTTPWDVYLCQEELATSILWRLSL